MSLLKDKPAGDPPPSEKPAEKPAENTPGNSPAASDRPEWAPEKFWDADKKEVRAQDLAKAYGELDSWRGNAEAKFREKFDAERLAGRPEKADAYELPKLEDARINHEELAGHPLIGWWRTQAHAMGLDQKGFEAGVSQYVDTVLGTFPDPAAEMKLIGENATARIAAVQAWAEKTFDESEFGAVQQIATTAAGFKALEKIRAGMEGGKPSIAAPGDPVPTTMTRAEVQKLMASKEYYDPTHRDPSVVEKVNKWFRENGGTK